LREKDFSAQSEEVKKIAKNCRQGEAGLVAKEGFENSAPGGFLTEYGGKVPNRVDECRDPAGFVELMRSQTNQSGSEEDEAGVGNSDLPRGLADTNAPFVNFIFQDHIKFYFSLRMEYPPDAVRLFNRSNNCIILIGKYNHKIQPARYI
jgi:hypothetical protein